MTEKIISLSVAKDFSETPGPRNITDGPFSGEEFYINQFSPKLNEVWSKKENFLLLDLDGTYSYPPSFISEIFTRAVHEFNDKRKLKEKIRFVSNDEPLLVNKIMRIIDETEIR